MQQFPNSFNFLSLAVFIFTEEIFVEDVLFGIALKTVDKIRNKLQPMEDIV